MRLHGVENMIIKWKRIYKINYMAELKSEYFKRILRNNGISSIVVQIACNALK